MLWLGVFLKHVQLCSSEFCVAEVLTSSPKECEHSVSFGTVTYVCAWSMSLILCCEFRKLLGKRRGGDPDYKCFR